MLELLLALASLQRGNSEVGGVIECQVSNFIAAAAFRVWFVVTERIVVLVPGQSAIIVAETTLVSPHPILEDLKKVH